MMRNGSISPFLNSVMLVQLGPFSAGIFFHVAERETVKQTPKTLGLCSHTACSLEAEVPVSNRKAVQRHGMQQGL